MSEFTVFCKLHINNLQNYCVSFPKYCYNRPTIQPTELPMRLICSMDGLPWLRSYSDLTLAPLMPPGAVHTNRIGLMSLLFAADDYLRPPGQWNLNITD